MTANKHTPGPWHVHKGTKWHHVRAFNGNWVMEANYSHSVVRQHADASLIAAAPELLEALMALEVLLSPLAYDSTQKDWLNRARAAIAKATGGAA